jgi:hypothetical protein
MISDIRKFLSGKKTYIAAGLLVVVCAAEYLGVDVVKDIDQTNSIKTAWEAVVAMTIRAGIAAKLG